MKKSILLLTLCAFALSNIANAAQPYNTKKAPKLLKAQSPTVIVKNSKMILPAAPLVDVKALTEDLAIAQPLEKLAPQKASKQVMVKPAAQVELSSSAYIPTANQVILSKRANKRIAKKMKNAKKTSSGKSILAATLFCFFLGYLGIHRFYMGYTGIGIIQLLTLGFLGIWPLIDLILLLVGDLEPKYGPFRKTMKEEINSI